MFASPEYLTKTASHLLAHINFVYCSLVDLPPQRPGNVADVVCIN